MGQLKVGFLGLMSGKRFHYMCFRREAMDEYVEVEGEWPDECRIVGATVAMATTGLIDSIYVTLFPTEEDDSVFWNPETNTYWKYNAVEGRWKETVLV